MSSRSPAPGGRPWAACRLALAPLLALLLTGGCRGGEDAASAAAQSAGGGRGGAGRGGAPDGMRVAVVEVAPVEAGSIARSVTVSGTVEPIRTVAVNSQLAGALLAVRVEEGDAVTRGAVLAQLDDRELQAQLASAEASYQVAESAHQRAERLRERQVITVPEYERDRTAYAAARAQLEQLRTRVGYATVRASLAGVVTEKRVEAGDVVAPQTRLFTIADVSTMVVRVRVSELDVVELAVGDAVDVALDAFPGRPLEGRIRRIFPSADPATRLVPVEVALAGEASRLARPGFLARATFALSARENTLLVPASAVVTGGGSEAVFVVEDGKAVRRTVETGLSSQGRIEVVAGLRQGEQVVTVGSNTLRDGMAVRVVGGAGTRAAGSTAGEGGAP
ncbi:MAG: efflux RND transporter periplasmic adaptor subunit [Gemmatimonadetes bacterium]|nr:efflux RND transporter periplasmic adaptor subunit [Gemmatimonadota bacterium]